jgi:hypothetical protein
VHPVIPAPLLLGRAGSVGVIRSVAAFLVAAGAGIAVLRFVGRSPADSGLGSVLGSIALGAPVAAAGLLAILALRGRAILLVPAASLLVPMSFLSFALVTLPLLAPAVLLFVAYGRRSRLEHRRGVRDALTVAVVIPLLIAAVVVLLVHQDPRSYATATESGSTSDVITVAEALLSLMLTTTAVTAGWVLAAPDRRVRQG